MAPAKAADSRLPADVAGRPEAAPPPAEAEATPTLEETLAREPSLDVTKRGRSRQLDFQGKTAPPGPPAAGGAPVMAGAAPSSAVHPESMLIYTAHLTLAVFQVDKGLGAVEALARSLDGYLATRADTEITIRVPRAHFAEAVAAIEKQGDVLHRQVTAQDVTDEYVDLEIRLRNARAMRDRLQELLKTATAKDALEIEKELGRVTESIERMEGRLKLLGDKIAYSTITVSFQPIDQAPVHDLARLPFPWLQGLGLSQLLNVHDSTTQE
jgi:hypothetical protein